MTDQRQAEGATGVRTHDLKCWTIYFDAVLSGAKPFALRRDDRDFRTGDLLRLRDWSPDRGAYTGRECLVRVTYLARGSVVAPLIGLPQDVRHDWVAMGIERVAEGATGGRWRCVPPGPDFLRFAIYDGNEFMCEAHNAEDAARLVDLLNRGESSPTEASLQALREAHQYWRDSGSVTSWSAKGAAMDRAIRAVLSSSAPEPGKVEAKAEKVAPCGWGSSGCGMRCAGCPRPAGYLDVPAHLIAADADDGWRPGKVEAKADDEHPDNALVDRLVAEHRPKATTRRILTRAPSPPEPQGAQGPLSGVEEYAARRAPDLTERERRWIATLDHARDVYQRVSEMDSDKIEALETQIAENDEARAKLARYEAAMNRCVAAMGKCSPSKWAAALQDSSSEDDRQEGERLAAMAAEFFEAWQAARDVAAPEPPKPAAAGEDER